MAAKVQSLYECDQDRMGRAGVWSWLHSGPELMCVAGSDTGLAGPVVNVKKPDCAESCAVPGAGQPGLAGQGHMRISPSLTLAPLCSVSELTLGLLPPATWANWEPVACSHTLSLLRFQTRKQEYSEISTGALFGS